MKQSILRTSAALALILGVSSAASAQINFNSGDDYISTGLGAVIGGAIGSNVAGGGVQDEGTAIGAVLGGLAGNYLYNQYSEGRAQGGYGYGYGAPSYGYAPAYGGGYGYDQGYAGGYQTVNVGSSRYGDYPLNGQYETLGGGYGYGNSYGSYSYDAGSSYYYSGGGVLVPPSPLVMPAPSYQTVGYVAGPVMTQTYQAPVSYQRVPVAQPVVQTVVQPRIIVSEPSVSYSSTSYSVPSSVSYSTSPSYSSTSYSAPSSVSYSTTSYSVPTSSVSTYETSTSYSSTPSYSSSSSVSYSAPSISSGGTAPCPAGTTPQGDGTCMQQASVSYSSSAYSAAPSYSSSSYSAAPSYSSASYSRYGSSSSATETAPCPAGTTVQADGSCMQNASVSYSSSYGSGYSSGYSSGTSYSSGSSYGTSSSGMSHSGSSHHGSSLAGGCNCK